MFHTFVALSLVVQTIMSVSWNRVAMAEATASTRMAATNASVVRATNTWCSTADPSASVSPAGSAPPGSQEALRCFTAPVLSRADLNECSKQDICGVGGQCINLAGSYKCECHSGFRIKSHRHPICEGTDSQTVVI